MTNHRAAYKAVIEQVLGQGTCTFDATAPTTNHVIGAIASPGFETFRDNFGARLKRLAQKYRGDRNFQTVADQANLVAGPQWQGAFAELAALDFFTSARNFMPDLPQLNVDIEGHRTLTSRMGNQGPANLDIHFSRYDVFSDVKVLKDNVSEILLGVLDQVLPNCKALVGYDYPQDAGYEDVKQKRRALVEELRLSTAGKQPSFVKSKVVPGLCFRFNWTGGVLVTESGYSPYRHAKKAHRLPFEHAKKFVTDRPFFLTFVVFPWFNGVVTSFRESNQIFYRSLSRRTFCQYRHDQTAFSSWRRFSGPETVYEVSRHLAGMLFLEDRTILSADTESRNVDGYLYLNPNAHQRRKFSMMEDAFLHGLDLQMFDDFKDDNY